MVSADLDAAQEQYCVRCALEKCRERAPVPSFNRQLGSKSLTYGARSAAVRYCGRLAVGGCCSHPVVAIANDARRSIRADLENN
jgi:hypothetical protein